jgi:hypothetical protein
MWAADTVDPIENFAPVERFLQSLTEQFTAMARIEWATHDVDRESVCFSLMVESVAGDGDDGLTDARLRAGRCLRSCLGAAGVLADVDTLVGCSMPPVRLRLDPWPLCLRRMQAAAPSEAALN